MPVGIVAHLANAFSQHPAAFVSLVLGAIALIRCEPSDIVTTLKEVLGSRLGWGVLGASLATNVILGIAFLLLWKVHRRRIEEKSKRVQLLEEKLIEGRLSSSTPPSADKPVEGEAGEPEAGPAEPKQAGKEDQ